MTLPKAIIVDIDGTLANINHRRHFVERMYEPMNLYEPSNNAFDMPIAKPNPKWALPDWDSFKAAMKYDTPNQWCADLVYAMYLQGCIILLVTGREWKNQYVTENLIEKALADIERTKYIRLFMRLDDDYRPDVEIKREIYDDHIKDKYEIIFAVDDRKCVVDLWRSLGIVCLDCAGYEK